MQTQRYEAFAPPHPDTLPKPRKPKQKKPKDPQRWRKRGMRLLYITGTGIVLYYADKTLYASALTRSARTFWAGLTTALDYKINFRAHPWTVDSIEELHLRSAERLFSLLRENGGLYLKIGQAIAMQSAVLPPAFQKMFSRMFDDAPQNSWDEVRQVIREEFGGKEVEEVFGDVIEHKARASASVAQVHWARLADGREVAVKVQKREIAAQVGWDLWTFKVVTWIYSKWFDIPFYSLVPYISERLMLETDFQNEADNAERMAELVKGESRLRDRVYIPKVYRDLTTKRVMTAEWIEVCGSLLYCLSPVSALSFASRPPLPQNCLSSAGTVQYSCSCASEAAAGYFSRFVRLQADVYDAVSGTSDMHLPIPYHLRDRKPRGNDLVLTLVPGSSIMGQGRNNSALARPSTRRHARRTGCSAGGPNPRGS